MFYTLLNKFKKCCLNVRHLEPADSLAPIENTLPNTQSDYLSSIAIRDENNSIKSWRYIL